MTAAPERIQTMMRDFKPDWFIAGGWAIDLFLGEITRAHDDIEIAVFRRDQMALRKFLSGGDLRKVVNGAFSEWKEDEYLDLPVHEIHYFNQDAALSSFEILLNENENGVWQFRRNRQITKPASEIYLTNESGIRFLSPEIVLLYKSKNPRPKDEQDFKLTVKHLGVENKRWLKNALSSCFQEHQWMELL